MRRKQYGFSLIELMVVIVLVTVVAALSIRISREVLAKSDVVTQAVTLKGMINQAKGFAMMNGVPVLFEYGDGSIRAQADFDHDSSFGDDSREAVLGTWNGSGVTPIDLGFKRVKFNYTNTINHWSGFQDDTGNFLNDEFVITPLGHIKSPTGSHGPLQGAMFLENEDGFLAAVYLSPLGDIKTAIKESASSDWSWND